MRRLLGAVAVAAATLLTVGRAAAAPPNQTGAFNFRFGGFFPSGSSDYWTYAQDNYSLDRSDFNGLNGGFGYTASITNYFEFDVNADFYAASTSSTDRRFEDQYGSSIIHDTRIAVFPVTVGFRVLPAGRYARRGAEGQHYVRRPVPYFGAGVGMAYWQFEEEGDFVFFDPTVPGGLSVFYDRVKDSGLAFETHANLGIEFPISPEWNLTLEVRQSWANASINSSFPSLALAVDDQTKLDLGGTSVFFGAAVRF